MEKEQLKHIVGSCETGKPAVIRFFGSVASEITSFILIHASFVCFLNILSQMPGLCKEIFFLRPELRIDFPGAVCYTLCRKKMTDK